MFGYNECRGDEAKRKIVDNYFINPIAHLPLSRWIDKKGCCGKLSKEYHVFTYTNIANRSDRGIFFLGGTCSKDLIEQVNKKRRGRGIITPAFFDSNFMPKTQNITTEINAEVLFVCNSLFVAWDLEPKESLLTNIMFSIYFNPKQSISEQQLLALNKIVSKDYLITKDECENLTESLKLRKLKDIILPTCKLKNLRSFFTIKDERMYF